MMSSPQLFRKRIIPYGLKLLPPHFCTQHHFLKLRNIFRAPIDTSGNLVDKFINSSSVPVNAKTNFSKETWTWSSGKPPPRVPERPTTAEGGYVEYVSVIALSDTRLRR